LRGIKDGHQICVHTWSHQYMTSFSNEVAFAELYYTRKIIKDILGVTPKCWRPPFGDVDNRVRVIAEGMNMTNIVWSDDSADWKAGAASDAITPEQVDANYQKVIDAQKNGSYSTHGPVVLTHELSMLFRETEKSRADLQTTTQCKRLSSSSLRSRPHSNTSYPSQPP